MENFKNEVYAFLRNRSVYLVGGLLLTGLASAFALSVRVAAAAFALRLEVSSRDRAYEPLLRWLSSRALLGVSAELSAVSEPPRLGESPQLRFLPGMGSFLFPFKGCLITVTHDRAPAQAARAQDPDPRTLRFSVAPAPWRALLRPLFFLQPHFEYGVFRPQHVFEALLLEALALPPVGPKCTQVFTGDEYGSWLRAARAPPRSPCSVVLADGVLERLFADLKDFYEQRRWYAARGIPYRRGYLLTGPPGTGKTSAVRAAAAEMGVDVYLLALEGKKDALVAELLREVPPLQIVLIEDVDSVFVRARSHGMPSSSVSSSSSTSSTSRTANGSERTSEEDEEGDLQGDGVSLGGLLNALDGVASQEGRVLFMTTNYVQRVPKAMLRPGRIDVRMEIGRATKGQVARMFENFFNGETELAARFAEKFGEGEVTTAALQGYLMNYKNEPKRAMEEVEERFPGKGTGHQNHSSGEE